MEEDIRRAFKSSLNYVNDNLSTLSMKALRRTLEQQLGVEAGTLDAYKCLLSELVDQTILGKNDNEENEQPGEDASKGTKARKQIVRAVSPIKNNKIVPVGCKSSVAVKQKLKNQQQKSSAEEKRKRRKQDESDDDEEGIEAEVVEKRKKKIRSDSEDMEEEEDGERARTKQTSGSLRASSVQYGPKVHKLRDICTRATIKIPPNVYAKNKGDDSAVAKALEELLAKHGLRPGASNDEIQSVRVRLAKERDLDGIDSSNIIQTDGRRPRRAAAAQVSYKTSFKVDSEDEEEDESDEESKGRDLIDISCEGGEQEECEQVQGNLKSSREKKSQKGEKATQGLQKDSEGDDEGVDRDEEGSESDAEDSVESDEEGSDASSRGQSESESEEE
ncbi:hypothetical protein CEUSTIGMA_g1352.t1 [Chlamydomonas eustigma]|uniref:Uncharacterized protein n=1 Tax=Chlamydomonas eustigma TaxID=1157962 RepID=A0A250WTB5_9CHLO|nr:hypothetical protein CEUSTIGMA_g1352.t1 [Chlamydomonas eustigma]|eukprot:GAX73902.1 hypothetical protein CEUSTIGMA_g1352.t1 [Chlamydomonas eustigma]